MVCTYSMIVYIVVFCIAHAPAVVNLRKARHDLNKAGGSSRFKQHHTSQSLQAIAAPGEVK